MRISEEQVRYVAALANLKLTEAEVARFRSDLDGILEHMDRLKEIDTSGVEPMAQVLFAAGETATLRDDLPVPRWATRRPWPTHRSPAADISKWPR